MQCRIVRCPSGSVVPRRQPSIPVRPMGFHKSTLVARGADTQLRSSCVSAPFATNVDLLRFSHCKCTLM